MKILPAATQTLAVCAWCFETIPEGMLPTEIAFRKLHPHCAGQFDAWVASDLTEWDDRWRFVTDDTPVCFEGRVCKWGSLMMADRKVCEMLSDGSLVGAYPV